MKPPSAEEFNALKAELKSIANEGDDEQSELARALRCLHAVLLYLAVGMDLAWLRPLWRVEHSLFHEIVVRSLGTTGGRPARSDYFTRGFLAGALDVLIARGGLKRAGAMLWLERELDCLSIDTDAQKVACWRDEANRGKGPKATRTVFWGLREHFAASPPQTPEQLELTAHHLVRYAVRQNLGKPSLFHKAPAAGHSVARKRVKRRTTDGTRQT